MESRSRPTKATRSYDGSRRREIADRKRLQVIDSAERLFLRDGYTPTTIAAIAADASVSPDTIYRSFGGKPGLVRSIRAKALEGTRPVPAEQRSDEMQAQEQDPRVIIRGWGALTAEIAPRVSPILILIRDAAATDPELGELLKEMDADRLRRMSDNARRLRDAGHLRPGMPLSEATDVLWTYSAPELYELLVLRRGWPPRRYGRFVAAAMIGALL